MNQSNWARVYTTQAPYKAEITKDVLEDEGIQSVVVDKQDTAYGGVFGEIELYVRREDVIKAKHIIDKKEL
ncbi:MAG: DUF2007 domain-containing protein [Bacteroidetes bacterium]|nr:DUF2007 domain-containing protein [Bacteroidota bacterium]